MKTSRHGPWPTRRSLMAAAASLAVMLPAAGLAADKSDETAAMAVSDAVEVVLWTAPKELVVGEKAILHVKYISKAPLKSPVMVVRAPKESWFTIEPHYRILKEGPAMPEAGGMPATGGGEKETGFPDKGSKTDETRPPPALGEVPTELFELVAHEAGTKFLWVDLYHAGGLARGALIVKVTRK